MPRERVHAQSQPGKDAATRTDLDDTVDQAVTDAQQRAAELEATDSLLDEIDEILQHEAEFAIHYLQKGGQALLPVVVAAASLQWLLHAGQHLTA